MTQAEIDAACRAAVATGETMDFPEIPENVLQHLECVVSENARKFSLTDDEREDLNSRLYHALVMAAKFGNWDPEKSTLNTYLCGVLDHELFDWRAERFADKPREDESDRDFRQRLDAGEWRDRRILYAPSRYGTAAKMIRRIDWNLALETLTDDERALLEAYVYVNPNLKDAGKGLGLSKNRTLERFASVKRKLARHYRRRLLEKNSRDQNSTVWE